MAHGHRSGLSGPVAVGRCGVRHCWHHRSMSTPAGLPCVLHVIGPMAVGARQTRAAGACARCPRRALARNRLCNRSGSDGRGLQGRWCRGRRAAPVGQSGAAPSVASPRLRQEAQVRRHQRSSVACERAGPSGRDLSTPTRCRHRGAQRGSRSSPGQGAARSWCWRANTDAWIAVTEAMDEFTASMHPTAGRRVERIPYGLDKHVFNSRPVPRRQRDTHSDRQRWTPVSREGLRGAHRRRSHARERGSHPRG